MLRGPHPPSRSPSLILRGPRPTSQTAYRCGAPWAEGARPSKVATDFALAASQTVEKGRSAGDLGLVAGPPG
eukprot:209072-Amorphochlora_amoeboformis.AAC.1